MPLPNGLLGAISHEDGGRVVLVVGAGCSLERPTNLPLARACAEEAHRRLVNDRLIESEDCADPTDLSCVADTVLAVCGTQIPLIERMPLTKFRSAEPNEGHVTAAAMMREHAIKAVVTLNFDLAISTALAQLGNKEVMTLTGPQDHRQMGLINLIYLHRNVDANPEDWILTTEALNDAWEGRWEQVVASAMLTSPVTVFAGLGSSAAVLTDSAQRIRAAIPNGVDTFQVDPGPAGNSSFFAALDIPEENYVQAGWVRFMRELASRLLSEHLNSLSYATEQLLEDEDLHPETVEPLYEQLAQLGLVEMGRLRAAWMLEATRYLPHRSLDPRYVSDLLLAVAQISRIMGCSARIEADGLIAFERDELRLGTVRLASGRGLSRWLALEPKLDQIGRDSPRIHDSPVLIAAVGPRPEAISPPEDITGWDQEQNIVSQTFGRTMLSVDELRLNPDRANELLH